MLYDPKNWFWKDKAGRIYSSAVDAFVEQDDPALVAFLKTSSPTPWPRDEAGNESAAELRAILEPLGIKGPVGAPSLEEARAECARRIEADVPLATQMNLNAYVNVLNTKPGLTDAEKDDLAAFGAGVQWIAAMRARWKELVDAKDPDWRDDDKWPAIPKAAADLAARY